MRSAWSFGSVAALAFAPCVEVDTADPPQPAASTTPVSSELVKAPELLLDRRPPPPQRDPDPIGSNIEELPEAISCATPVARGRRLRRTVPRVEALYDACSARLAAPLEVLSPEAARTDQGLTDCMRLVKVLIAGEACTPDAILADGIAARACARGLLPACAALADARFEGAGAAADPECAERVLADTCERGDLDACGDLAMKRAGGHKVPHDTASALELGTRACEGGSFRGCLALEQLGVRPDEHRAAAVRVARRACDAGDGGACEQLATSATYKIYGKLLDVPFDREEGKRLRARACARGSDHACIEAARDLPHEELAARCAGGELELCASLRYQTDAPLGPVLQPACRAGIGVACWAGGGSQAMLDEACAARTTEACRHNHRFVPDDASPEQSVLACDNGSGIDCFRLGEAAARRGDEATALGFFEKGCPPLVSRPDRREIDPAACRELARGLLRKGDATAAAPLFGKACFMGSQSDGQACIDLASMYESGTGVERNLERAFDIYVGTCARARRLPDSDRACTILQERRMKHLDLVP